MPSEAKSAAGEEGRAAGGLLRWLDDEPHSRRSVAFLLVVALGLVWFWLPEITYALYSGALLAGERAQPADLASGILLRRMLANGLVAFFAGVLAGRATRKFGWLVAPLLLGAAFCGGASLLVIRSLQGALPGSDIVGILYRYWDSGRVLQEANLLFYGGTALCAMLGGALSRRLIGPLKSSALAAVAIAWIIVVPLEIVIRIKMFQATGGYVTSEWSAAALALRAHLLIPYLIAGVWLGVGASRPTALWGGASVGLIPLFNILRGYLTLMTLVGESFALLYLPHIAIPFVSAGCGVCLGLLATGEWSWRRALLAAGLLVFNVLATLLLAAAG